MGVGNTSITGCVVGVMYYFTEQQSSRTRNLECCQQTTSSEWSVCISMHPAVACVTVYVRVMHVWTQARSSPAHEIGAMLARPSLIPNGA